MYIVEHTWSIRISCNSGLNCSKSNLIASGHGGLPLWKNNATNPINSITFAAYRPAVLARLCARVWGRSGAGGPSGKKFEVNTWRLRTILDASGREVIFGTHRNNGECDRASKIAFIFSCVWPKEFTSVIFKDERCTFWINNDQPRPIFGVGSDNCKIFLHVDASLWNETKVC